MARTLADRISTNIECLRYELGRELDDLMRLCNQLEEERANEEKRADALEEAESREEANA
jgi:hypothetical protein